MTLQLDISKQAQRGPKSSIKPSWHIWNTKHAVKHNIYYNQLNYLSKCKSGFDPGTSPHQVPQTSLLEQHRTPPWHMYINQPAHMQEPGPTLHVTEA